MLKHEQFNIGDHLCSRRVLYTHHGLYMGNGFVIEYDREHGVQIVTVADFTDNESGCELVEHDSRLYDRRQCVLRALSRLGEDRYNLVFNNCEHFVNWCIEGQAVSYQVQDMYAIVADAVLGYLGSKGKGHGLLKLVPVSDVLVKTLSSFIDSSLASNCANEAQVQSFESRLKALYVKEAQKSEKSPLMPQIKAAVKDSLSSSKDFVKSIDKKSVQKGAVKTYDMLKDGVYSGIFDNDVARTAKKQVGKITDNKTILNVSAGAATLVTLKAGAMAGGAVAATIGLPAATALGVCVAVAGATNVSSYAKGSVKKIIRKKIKSS